MTNITIHEKATVNAVGSHTNGNAKQLLCLNTGIIYASASDASKENACSLSEVSKCCRGLVNHVKGNRYCYVTNITNHLSEISEVIQKYSVIVAEQEAKERKEKAKAKITMLEEKYAKVRQKYEDKLNKAYEELESIA